MMRSLWTAASGMISQQQNVDTISHNLANVNTPGYKKERAEFKSLLYETMRRADQDPANPAGRPVNLQVGHGVRIIATAKIHTQGNLQRTDHPLDVAIEGDGFFVVRRSEDEICYTKDGSFKVSVDDNGSTIVTAEGYAILGVDGEPIVIPSEILMSDIIFASDGTIYYPGEDGQTEDSGYRLNIVQFPNIQGLESLGSNLLKETPASGAPMMESEGEVTRLSILEQGVIEMANVQVAEEMVNLIVAQRAYDLNSKAIQTSDDMLQQANNLKR